MSLKIFQVLAGGDARQGSSKTTAAGALTASPPRGVAPALRRPSPAAPPSDETLIESAVLSYVIAERPDGVTIPDLSRDLLAGLPAHRDGDAVERAVRELVGAGLIEVERGRVLPRSA